MKRLLSLILALLLFLCSAPLSVFAEKDPIYDLSLDSQGVYLFNLETGTALYEKAENSRMFPASLTKIMTALVVLENCKDPKSETITVESMSMFDYIIEDGGVHMELKSGETFTVYDLLVGLMISSFCDVADLLAQHFGDGEISNFIDKMNDTAQRLGLENTHFENAHGLHHSNHYSSPKDIALFFQKAMENETFREIVSLRSYTIPATSRHAERQLRYTVSIYYETSDWYLPCYIGGKSGYTDRAGRCLATYSEKDGVSYISVLLGANLDGNRRYPGNMSWIETHTLLSYAYDNFAIRTVFEEGEKVGEIPVIDSEESLPVVAGEEVRTLVRNGADPVYQLNLPETISVDKLENGKKIGSLQLYFNSEQAGSESPLLLSWDGTPIKTKSALEKGAEGAAKAISGIFREDKVFVTLFIFLLLVIFITLPAIRLTHRLHRKKSHKPKH